MICKHALALCTWKEIKTRQPTEESENEYAIFLKQQASLVEQGELYILHKVCADQFEMAHGGNEYRWPWLEFIDLLFFLTSNSGITFEDLQRVEVEREEMGW